MDPPEIVPPGCRYSMKTPNPESKILVDYQVRVSQEKDLSELRVDVGELNLILAVDTDIQPHETFQVASGQKAEPLSAIHIMIDLEGKAPEKIILTPDGNESIFNRKTVPFTVPLDRYLEPEGRLLQYKVTFQFKNGTQLATDQLRHNYSDTRLTIRRQTLHKLLFSDKGTTEN